LINFGRLYNWHAIQDDRGICPAGWHVPLDLEFLNLVDHAGGIEHAGLSLKAEAPSWDGSNQFGFSALPAGACGDYLNFYSLGWYSVFWSSTPSAQGGWSYSIASGNDGINRGPNGDPNYGFSVRCIQDSE